MERGDVQDRRLTRLVLPLTALVLLAWLTTVALLIANRSAIRTVTEADPIDVVLPIGFGIIGTLLASRKPRNPTGWIFLGMALLAAVGGVITQYVFRGARFGPLPFVAWVAWAHDPLTWLLFPPGLATFFFLLFPDGHLPSRRWRWLAGFAAVTTVVGFAFLILQTEIQITGTPAIPNPLGSIAVVDTNHGAPGLIWFVGIAIVVTAMASTVLRIRRSSGELRQQLRWLAFATVLTAVAMVGLIGAFAIGFQPPQASFEALIILGYGIALPVACGVAILKHGLYELDVVISKTVVYALLAAFFTAVYLAIVVGIGSAIGQSGNNSFLTVLAAATIAVAFNPVRDRAKRFANRIVYGRRATPYEVLSEFSERMGETYSVEDVLPRMATLLGQSTGAREAVVWLRVGAELRPSASWGEGSAGRGPLQLRMTDGELPDFGGTSKVAAVRHRDELLGALMVTKPPNDPLTAAEDKLVNDLAGQAGLVLRNVRLTEELRANLDELRASRQRLVAAQDGERRRIERNIHDGAQQQLVALAVQARLAENLAGRDPGRERELLRDVQQGLQGALEDLRDLARGIYPPLLADQGLVAALDAQARRSAVPVDLQADGVGRYAQEAEAALYFCVLEALQNVAKYAAASRATVGLEGSANEVRFRVVDDGRGFDPVATGYGSGVQGMADRLAALGGELTVRSSPGAGTTIEGRLPV
jgi:signal transduction histidine kinase